MSSTTFIDGQTVVTADWANDVNVTVYTALGNGTTVPATATDVKTNLSLNLVDNTSDVNKPISTDTQTALNLKASITGAETLSNKSISLSTNTITGTVAQFNTALTDDNFTTLTGTETITNKTLVSSKLKAAQLGDSGTATNNFTLTAEAVDGSMKLARGNVNATTQDVMTVDASGKVAFPQNFIGFQGSFAGSGIVSNAVIPFVVVRNDGGFFTGSRFQPNVAGWYSVGASLSFSSTTLTYAGVDINKTGSPIRRQVQGPYSGTAANTSVSAEVYLNGTTDYIEFFYIFSGTGGTLTSQTYCSGCLLRAV